MSDRRYEVYEVRECDCYAAYGLRCDAEKSTTRLSSIPDALTRSWVGGRSAVKGS